MGQLTDSTIQRIAERSQFQNETLKSLLTAYAQKSFALAASGVEVENIAEDLGIDPVDITDELTGLAQLFGETSPTLSADSKAKIKQYVNGIVDEENPDLESALENYFSATLEMETAYNETSAGVNALIPGE